MKYEANKTYTMTVLFADAKGRYLNVQSAPPDKEVFKIDIAGKLARPPKSLSGKHIDVVCTGEAVDVPPNFMLAEKYFAAVPPVPKVGKCLGIDEGLRVEFKKTIIYPILVS